MTIAMLASRAMVSVQVLFFQIPWAERNARSPRTRVIDPSAVLIVPGLKLISANPPKVTIPPPINCNSVRPRDRELIVIDGAVSFVAVGVGRSPRPAK